MDFSIADLLPVAVIVFVQITMSIDNALVLAMIARRLPQAQQRKALTYGLAGAFIFQIVSLGFAAYLMNWIWAKLLGGAYLLYIALHYFIRGPKSEDEQAAKAPTNFWKTVLLIELMDMAFAVDSIIAAVGMSRKLSVVYVGCLTGLVLMRFVAGYFIKLLKIFPHLEDTAHFLILLIGVKVVLSAFEIPYVDFHSLSSPAHIIFWVAMLASIAYGFVRRSPPSKELKDDIKEIEKTIGE